MPMYTSFRGSLTNSLAPVWNFWCQHPGLLLACQSDTPNSARRFSAAAAGWGADDGARARPPSRRRGAGYAASGLAANEQHAAPTAGGRAGGWGG